MEYVTFNDIFQKLHVLIIQCYNTNEENYIKL